jgi:anti-sigma factor RsiW
MTCELYQAWLQRSLDGEDQGDRDVVERHLCECPACRALDDAVPRLREGLLALTPPRPPADLADRIVGQVRRERARTRRIRIAWAAVAAGLLLTIGIRAGWSRIFPPAPTHHVPEQAVKPEEPIVPLRASVAEAGTALASLTTRTADETVGQTRLLIPTFTGPPFEEVGKAPAVDTPSQSLRDAGQGVSEGLEPVANSARRAVGLFLREIPPMPGETKRQF